MSSHEKVAAQGGKQEGKAWDDGADNNGVRKISVWVGRRGVQCVTFYYDKSGQITEPQQHGSTTDVQKPEQFEITDPNDYLVSVVGYHEDDIIQGLQFITQKTSSRVLGYDEGAKFTLEGKDKKIVGFHGSAEDYLNSLGVYFLPGASPSTPTNPTSPNNSTTPTNPTTSSNSTTTTKLDAQGGKVGKRWDDGAGNSGVRKISVWVGRRGVYCVKFYYDKSGKVTESEQHGSITDEAKEKQFEITDPNDYLVSVVGYHEDDIIQGLQFITNKTSSAVLGYDEGAKFTLEVKDAKIVGFHGSAEEYLHSVGAYFVSSASPSTPTPPARSEAHGGKGGKEWDDGADHDAIKNIAVGLSRRGVHYVRFGYDKGGQLQNSPDHGSSNGVTSSKTFLVTDPDEYLLSVVGYHEDDVIQGLQFITNKKTSEVYGFDEGTKFTLGLKDKKIIGFHGSAARFLISLGAYFGTAASTPIIPTKTETEGGKGGTKWDDGADHNGVKNIDIGYSRRGVHCVTFGYSKGGQLQNTPVHGDSNGVTSSKTFSITDPDEYLVSVVGYHEDDVIQGLQFITNKKSSEVYGYNEGTKFTLGVKDKKIVGFHGSAARFLISLGAYLVPAPPTPINKLEAEGGKGKTPFDDGTFDGVRKVHVGQGDSGVSYVMIEYEKGGKLETRDHGQKTMLGTEEFPVKQGDYITFIEGYYDKIFGNPAEVITCLIFKTSNGETSQPYGVAAGKKFELDGKGGKLVGFHGSVGDVLHSLGAYFAPATSPLTPAN